MTLQDLLNLINQASSIQDFAKDNLLKLADSGDGRYILNYDEQGLDTPKSWISHYCRALTLAGEPNNYTIIAKGFDRFYNLGESPEYLNGGDTIDFTKPFYADFKYDGSLILMYFWNGKWRVNTRGSFAQGKVSELYGDSWEDLFWEAFKKSQFVMENFDPSCSYVFELCSPYNQVVEYYSEPKIEYLSMFHSWGKEGVGGKDSAPNNSFDEVTEMLSKLNPTQEGFILRQYDVSSDRWIRRKVKTASWCALAHLKDSTLQSDSKLWNVVFTGEIDEVISVFPHLKDKLEEKDKFYKDLLKEIQDTYELYKNIESQKDFAAAINHIKYKSILFNIRRRVTYGVYPSSVNKPNSPTWTIDNFKNNVQEYIIKNY
jgi:hypothetical protein